MVQAPIRLMAHLVAGFPDEESSYATADALVRGGASILEVQLAFSDPSADGPAIQTASTLALKNKCSVASGFRIIKKIRENHPEIPLFLMTYGSLAFTPGIENFVREASLAKVSGLIIPDLPFDCDEGLTELCEKFGLDNIPVAAPSMRKERIELLTQKKFPYIYAALRAGTTGKKTTIDSRTLEFIDTLAASSSKILGGFGIQNGEQSKTLSQHVYAVVAGSVFVNVLLKDPKNFSGVEKKAKELSGLIN